MHWLYLKKSSNFSIYWKRDSVDQENIYYLAHMYTLVRWKIEINKQG